MVVQAPSFGLTLPDRELACAPIQSDLGAEYLGAMRAGINCALANREIITHLARLAFAEILPKARLEILYDVSHNTCKLEEHAIDGVTKRLFVHRKGATRAFGPSHPALPEAFRARLAASPCWSAERWGRPPTSWLAHPKVRRRHSVLHVTAQAAG
jgi:tRNA-splicing ligase RtcB